MSVTRSFYGPVQQMPLPTWVEVAIEVRTVSLVPGIVDRVHVFEAERSDGRYLGDVGPDFAQRTCGVPPGSTMTAPGGYACNRSSSNTLPKADVEAPEITV